MNDKGFYTVVGYDKDNDVYVEYGDYHRQIEAEHHARELADLVYRDKLRRENGEPIDWIEIVQTDDWDVVYWVSYEEDECGNRIV